MTDRELLQHAATAAGISIFFDPHCGPMVMHNKVATHRWNPLVRNADAFELGVKLGLLFGINEHGNAVCFSLGGDVEQETPSIDECAALRRAIVRAAARIEMGKT